MRWCLMLLFAGASTLYAQRSARTLASAIPTIAKADSEWLEAMRAHDVARIVAPYDSNAVFILTNGESVRGRAAIADMYRARFAKIARVSSGGIAREDARAVNDTLIYEWGHGGMTYADSAGATHTSTGAYLTVWCRKAHGHWAIVRNLVF